MRTRDLPRLRIAHLPTPVEALSRLGESLSGLRLWIKRDDQTGLAFGGNKARKLEYLLADAQAKEARTLITTGAVQSNHCRQTAAAAARHGFDCILVLGGNEPSTVTGNVLLDHLLGAEIVWAGDKPAGELIQETYEVALQDGRQPYLIPYGGSSAIGVAAYVRAMVEFIHQGVPVDRIVLASSSGGTQAGLVLGARINGFDGRITGISVDRPRQELIQSVRQLALETADALGVGPEIDLDGIEVIDDYLGGGYAVVGELESRAVRRFARTEGILLDPIYTGRAAGGMMDLIDTGAIDAEERVLFWHTGGTPALFAYSGDLL